MSNYSKISNYDCLLFGFDNDPFLKLVCNKLLTSNRFSIQSLTESVSKKFQLNLSYKLRSSKYEYLLSLKDFNQKLNQQDTVEVNKIVKLICDSYYPSLDRFYLISESLLNRELLLIKHISYWINFFKVNGPPKIILFESTPHMPLDLALFGVLFNLKTTCLTIQKTHLNNKIIITPLNYLVDSSKNVYFDLKFDQELNEATNYGNFDNVWIQKSRIQKNINKKYIEKNVFSKLLTNFKYLFLSLFKIIVLKKVYYWNLSRLKLILLTLKLFNNTFKFRKSLDKGKHFNFNEYKYIYYGLQYQPERTTIPEAGKFWNQVKTIFMLASSLPEGWKLVINEHPNQLAIKVINLRKFNYRSTIFYEILNKIDNVFFIINSSENKDLINGAEIVSSCTGSIIWEALSIGKPVISFTNSIPFDFTGLDFVKNKKDIKNSIDKLIKLSAENIRSDFVKTNKEIDKYTIHSVNSSVFITENNKEMYIKNLVDAIIKILIFKLDSNI